MTLDPGLAAVIQRLEGLPGMADGTPEQARALREQLASIRDPAAAATVASAEDRTIAGVPVRVYRPDGAGPVATLVYFHGGGFVVGSIDGHDPVCRRLCRDVGAVVVNVGYPLAPEHPFPAGLDACWEVVQVVAAGIAGYGGDAALLAVGGDSSGANFATVCALRARDSGLTLAAQLLVYPVVDLTGDYPSREENGTGYLLTMRDFDWFTDHYLGIAGGRAGIVADPALTRRLREDPRISPLRAESLAGIAPAVVATAQYDPLRDEGNAYAEALLGAGVRTAHREFPGLIHTFFGLEQFSAGAEAATQWILSELSGLLDR